MSQTPTCESLAHHRQKLDVLSNVGSNGIVRPADWNHSNTQWNRFMRTFVTMWMLCAILATNAVGAADKPSDFRIAWKDNILTVTGKSIPGDELKVWYLEAYCRPGSTDRDWGQTTIGHRTELISADPNGKQLALKCTLDDGVTVEHAIEAVEHGVEFHLTAHNPTNVMSQAHWAQPCMRVDKFTGGTQQTYLEKSFVFYDGQLTRMPTRDWATKARYTPGQVWAAPGVDRNDVNPRPLSGTTPSSGLIGCFSHDESAVVAMAWEPYQELFQGVIVCLHADFRIGGLEPGTTKKIRGKIYLMKSDIPDLLKQYEKDFPEHVKQTPTQNH